MLGHGWVSPDSFTYALVVERPECDLTHLLTGTMEVSFPGSTKLIAARCVSSVLTTLWTLFVRTGIVCTSLSPEVLSVRHGWQSGFLNKLEPKAASPAMASTTGWPYYSYDGPYKVTVGDTYVAAVVTFLELIAPATFNAVVDNYLSKATSDRPNSL